MPNNLLDLYLQTGAVSTDTRNIIANSIFFALKGANFDGNQFVEKALESGAAYAVGDAENLPSNEKIIRVDNALLALQQLAHAYRKYLGVPIIALTGSNGKTTTKEILKSVLQTKLQVFATHGNLNNHIGVPLSLLSLDNTHQLAIIEMGANHQKEIEALCKIAEPNYGLITNVGKAHLEGFGGFEGVIQGKTEMYRYLQSLDSQIFYNAGNEWLKPHAKLVSKRFPYAVEPNLAEVWAEALPSETTLNVMLHTHLGDTEINTNLTGAYNLENIACAAAIALQFGLTNQDIKEGVEGYIPTNSRSQLKKTAHNQLILDAYNANPTSMTAAIENLAGLKEEKFFILGDMFELGDASAEEHKNICNLLEKYQLKGILVGEHFSKINTGFLSFTNAEQAKHFLETEKISGKTILVKGSRGVALEKVIDAL
ncbi:MAG: UDP-N-acetylmuramoyl-tripeptide--D-alanyl-D-alanine ligase [Luteibaculaceae bacterium]